MSQLSKGMDKMDTNKIIEENIEYVKNIAQKLSKTIGISSDELESYGYEGLMYAARNYDQEKSSNIYNYMYKTISCYMLSGIPNIIGYVGNINSYWNYKKAIKELNIDDSSTIDLDETSLIVEKMANECEIQNTNSLKNSVLLNNVGSLEQEYSNSDMTYLEKLSETIEEDYITNELRKLIFESLDVLTDKERSVIIKRYGLNNNGMKTYDEIAEEGNLDRNRVMQIESKALRKLRHPRVSNKLASYMDFDMSINGRNPSVEVGRSIS